MVRSSYLRVLALGLILVATVFAATDPRVTIFSSGCRNALIVLSGGKPIKTFEIQLVGAEEHLPDNLSITPEQGLINQLKYITKNSLLSKAMGRWLRAHDISDRGEAPAEVAPAQAAIGPTGAKAAPAKVDLSELMERNHLYTFVIQDGKLIFTSGGNTVGESVYSKHMNLAMFKDVNFAGEMFLDSEGILHVNNASGTYRPDGNLLEPVEKLFTQNFNVKGIEIHARGKAKEIGGKEFQAPEVEAKFETPDWKTFEDLKGLEGRKITLVDSDGHPVEYVLKTWATYKNTDTFYDTPDLDIFHKDGLLRERRRFKDTTGDNLRDIMFQAKDEADQEGNREEAVFARNEVRGDVGKHAKKWDDAQPARLGTDTKDEAVKFAREYAAGDKPLAPVLRIDQQRTYIFAYPTKGNPITRNIPVFQVSVDDVTATGLVGKKAVDRRPQVEIEVFGELPLGLSKVTEEKQRQLDQFTASLQKEYKLIPSQTSKYGTGVKAAILGDPEAPQKRASGQ